METEEGLEYLISPFRLVFPAADAIPNGSYDIRQLRVTPGEQREPDYDLRSLFSSPLPFPVPDADPLRVDTQLTKEQLAAGDTVVAVLLQDSGDYCTVLAYESPAVDGGQISAVFPSCLVCYHASPRGGGSQDLPKQFRFCS